MNNSENSRNGHSLNIPRFLELLSCGTVRDEHGMLRWSSNCAFLVSVADEVTKALAVYKPQRGERPLWDFPDGTLCLREVAAFLISDALTWHIVPPTVLRDGPRGLGSLQYYVESNPEVNYFSLDERYTDRLRQFAAFDYVINNADRKGGHCLLDKANHLWGIDHGIGFHASMKLRTVIWDFAGQAVPDALLADIDRVCAEVDNPKTRLHNELDRLLASVEVSALVTRMRRIVQRREYPRPGPGPNYPWPPV
jgi:hypothetical protein